jgi:hypothetical protein
MEQSGDTRFAARGVVAIDEVSERIERQMLGEGHPERQAAWLDRQPPARLVKREPEDGAVQRVYREAERAPTPAAREGLAEDGDVGVVVAKETHVERLDRSPHERGDGSGRCGLPARMHTL